MPSFQCRPYALDGEQVQTVNSWGASILVKATCEQTDGAFNLFDVTCLPGYFTSLHIHYAEDIAIYVLEGSLTIFWGNEKHKAAAGSFFYQPRGTPHGFRVEGEMPAQILYLNFPAGFDQFVVEQNLLAPNSEPLTAAARYKIEILGPLPD